MNVRKVISAALCGAIFFVFMGDGSHYDSDDALYAQMAREMVETGDFIDNRWSGSVLFEKPPLYLWSLAVSGAALGWSEWAMRLPGTLFAMLALAALFLIARRLQLEDGAALTAVGLLCTSYLFVLMTRRLMTDVPLLAMSLCAAAAMLHDRSRLFGVFCGLAVLAKGPAAGPLLLCITGYGLWVRALSWRQLGWAVLIGLGVAAPWHLAETVRHGAEFWQGYVGYHVGARATSSVVPGLTVGQMLEVLAAERLLLLAAAFGLAFAVKVRLRRPADRFALLWLAVTLPPALLSTTRLPHYLLPCVPALALLAVSAIPVVAWSARLAPVVAVAVVALAFLDPLAPADEPHKLRYWADPDFGADQKALGELIASEASDRDLVAAYNANTAALTFYANRRVLMATDLERFYAIQNAVLMVRRAGVLHRLAPRGFPGPAHPNGYRFVVARDVDLQRLVARLAGPRPLFVQRAREKGGLVLVNDAGIGEAWGP